MINCARTLLLNEAATMVPCGEYIPPDYVPQTLSPQLQQIWDVLFGAETDEYARNYRIQQLMALLHSTELSEYVYALDPRITYLPFNADLHFQDEPTSLVPISQLLFALEAVVSDQHELFNGVAHKAYQKFKTIWNEDRRFIYRLSALLLAFIYKVMESIPEYLPVTYTYEVEA